MIVYIVSRMEGGRIAIWSPFARQESAMGMVDAHLKFRVENGATLQRRVSFTPAPVVEGTKVRVGGTPNHPVWTSSAPIVECCIHESELIAEDKTSRAVYRICQHVVVE